MAAIARLVNDDRGTYSFPLDTDWLYLARLVKDDFEYGPVTSCKVKDGPLLGWGQWEWAVEFAWGERYVAHTYFIGRTKGVRTKWPPLVAKAIEEFEKTRPTSS